jgi:hypothetical protein
MKKMGNKTKVCANFILKETEKIVKREKGKKLPKGVIGSANFCPLAQVFRIPVTDGTDVPLNKTPKVKAESIKLPGIEKTPCYDVNSAFEDELDYEFDPKYMADSLNRATITKEEAILTEFVDHFDKGHYPHLVREATQKELDKDERY